MPLYIKDPRVAEMAEQLQALTNAASKTEAVGKALERAIEEARRELLAPELERAVAIARQIGRHDDHFDQKDLQRRDVGPLVVIDASAVIAVLAEEPKGREVVQALKDHGGPFAVPPMTVFESTLGLARARLGLFFFFLYTTLAREPNRTRASRHERGYRHGSGGGRQVLRSAPSGRAGGVAISRTQGGGGRRPLRQGRGS